MSSTIMQDSSSEDRRGSYKGEAIALRKRERSPVQRAADGEKNPFLVSLGERVRALRSRRGLARKALAEATGVSERHLANLEYGTGNASILILIQVADALQCSLAELLGDVTTSSPEWLMLRELLEDQNEENLRRVRVAVTDLLGTAGANPAAHRQRSHQIALVGLRGAGKSTLGARLADDLGFPFVELSREIEQFAGCSVGEIQALYGQSAYRRYERRALEESIQIYPEAVIATPGGIVSDPSNFNVLLAHCTTIWLKATPEDHMERVVAQGDTRPMSGNREAMSDLHNILNARAEFYSKAEFTLDTSAQPLAQTARKLYDIVAAAIGVSSAEARPSKHA